MRLFKNMTKDQIAHWLFLKLVPERASKCYEGSMENEQKYAQHFTFKHIVSDDDAFC